MSRTVKIGLLAFSLGFLAMALGGTSLRFLWVAYQHGGL
jgi:hypothetical protein